VQQAVTDDSDDGEGGKQGGKHKKPTKLAQKATDNVQQTLPAGASLSSEDTEEAELAPTVVPPKQRSGGRRMPPVHQSKIQDRPEKKEDEKSSLKIKVELDLEVEVELWARVKGDVTIGLL
jgi:hypothetical protein